MKELNNFKKQFYFHDFDLSKTFTWKMFTFYWKIFVEKKNSD